MFLVRYDFFSNQPAGNIISSPLAQKEFQDFGGARSNPFCISVSINVLFYLTCYTGVDMFHVLNKKTAQLICCRLYCFPDYSFFIIFIF